MVSKGGGGFPRWRGDGKKLFYTGQLQQMAVEVTADKTFQAGSPAAVWHSCACQRVRRHRGRQAVSLAAPEGSNTQTPFTVVLNWQAGLKKVRRRITRNQNDTFPLACTRVDAPAPCATATLILTTVAANHTPPPTPRFIV